MFRFRLQRVLDLRKRREEAIAGQMMLARGAEDRARIECEALERAREQSAEHAADAQTRQQTVGQLQTLSYVVERLDDHVETARRDVEEAREQAARWLEEFNVAFRERRVLDRLRDRDLMEWHDGELHDDRRRMDDIALGRFVRRADPDSETDGE